MYGWDIRTCKRCQKPLERWSRKTYCTDACKQAAYRCRHDPESGSWARQRQRGQSTARTKAKLTRRFNCNHCQAEVICSGNQALQKYCTPTCKQRAYRERQKERHL